MVCQSISACLDSQSTDMTVIFSVPQHQCSSHMIHYIHIYSILSNIGKGTPIIHALPISVQLSVVINVDFSQQSMWFKIDICFNVLQVLNIILMQ